MKKIFKTIGWGFLSILILLLAYCTYVYQSSPFLKAIVNNNESKIYYLPSKEVKPIKGHYKEYKLEVEDSINIYTYLFEPKSKAKADIFLVKGNSGNISSYLDLIHILRDNGYSIYTLDWRGYGYSNGVPTYKNVMKDTEKAFEHFLKVKNYTLKTIVYGMSLGAQPAIKITKDNQSKINALVLDGAIESAQSFLLDNVNIDFLRTWIKDNPENYNQDYVAVRDISEINNIPKLIIHSKKDRAVPFVRGQHIFKAAKEPKEFWKTNTKHIRTLNDLTDKTIEKLNKIIQ